MWKSTVMDFEQAYAAAGKVKHGSYYAMQDMTSEICNNVTVPSAESTAILIDTRDDNTYTVAKLLDEKCWMTQNLRISDKTLTPSDTDTNVSITLVKSNNQDWGSHNTNTNHNVDNYIDPNTKIGGYYSWIAAIASDTINGISTSQNYNHPYSICPKGWRLTSKNDFDTLQNYYSYTSIVESPATFVRAGWYASFVTDNQKGYYWTSTVSKPHNSGSGPADAYRFIVDTDSLRYDDYYYTYGAQIRCITR